MPTAPPPSTTAGIRALLDASAACEVAYLVGVVEWAHAHAGGVIDEQTYRGRSVLLGGVGSPLVDEFDVYELAAVLGVSADAGTSLVGRVLELAHRLPRLWARAVDLQVPVWKAFRIADQTINLPPDAAAHVDRHLAPFAHACSFAQIDRTVAEAIALFDPEEAERRRVRDAEQRCFDIHTSRAGIDGVVDVTGALDLADALDLEQAVQAGATALADAGCEETLDVRRSLAVGELARGQATLPLAGGGRAVTIYAHVHAGSNVATVDNTHAHVLIEQVRGWCGAATTVTIKPVIDLSSRLECAGYEPSDRLREQVVLRDKACVIPSCTRPARRCDLDHLHEHAHGGATASDNLAPLCRRHHRTKTHTSWRYHSPVPGLYRWTSPSGFTFTTDRRPPPRP